MRLNLGCGSRKLEGWVNVDKVAACAPDQVADLESFPWPWPDDSVDEVMLSHVLEHLGAATDTYLGIIQELYRVCRNGAEVTVIVPHPRHDDFLHDPTHVRAVTPGGLSMFSQALNREWIEKGLANTPLGLYLGVDFAIQSVNIDLDEPWFGLMKRGEISEAEIAHTLRSYNNVATQIRIVMQAVKAG